MTLSQVFDLISNNPGLVVFYFGAIMMTSILAGFFSKGEAHVSPWSYLYSILVYGICLPGIFAITLNVYTFIFENKSIYDMNVFVHFLPIIAMFLTLIIIKNSVNFRDIPGFNKLSALISILSVLMILLWILEKTNIFIISFMPFQYAFLMIVGLLIFLRFAFKRLF